MTKENQHNILIGSILKPHDDHRLYEKWGRYFGQKKSNKVHIFGLSNNSDIEYTQHTALKYNSISKRIKAITKFYKLLRNLKPEIVIISTFELLFVSFLYSKINKETRFYYDVIENYSLNCKHQNNYPKWQTTIIKAFINLNELFCNKFIDHYFYTEKIYLQQLPFLKKHKATLIENRYSYPYKLEKTNQKKQPNFLITGTLSNSYGLSKGIDWFLKIKKILPEANLHIIGHSTQQVIIPKYESIEVNSSDTPIQHQTLLKEIQNSDCILMPYEWTKSFYGCTPSKLYEAIELKTPIIITKSQHLEHFKSDSIFQIKDKEDINKKSLDLLLSSDFDLTEDKFEDYYPTLDTIF